MEMFCFILQIPLQPQELALAHDSHWRGRGHHSLFWRLG
jgi:hypothetical protein